MRCGPSDIFGQKSNKSSGHYNYVEYENFRADDEGDPHSWLWLWRPACALALDLPHHSAQSQSASQPPVKVIPPLYTS